MDKGLERDDNVSLNLPLADVFQAIETEVDYAERFVVPEKQYYTSHTLGEFILMINQYAAQAQQKWTHHGSGGEFPESLHEVRKIAAFAVRCMKQHGAPPRVVSKKELA